MRNRLLPLLILLVSLVGCGSSSKTEGKATPLIYDFRPGRANLNPGTSTLLLANFVGGTASIDQGVGVISSGVPVNISPAISTTYTLTVKGSSGDPATASTTVIVGPTSVDISPAQLSLSPGQSQTFSANVTGLTDTRVIWSAEGGTITQQGLFTAGAAPGAYLISAQSLGLSTLCAKAFVTVLAGGPPPPPPPVPVSISISVPLAVVSTGRTTTFSAQVTGTTNSAVTWTASAGSITPGGVFTAPASPGVVIITATSVADPTKSASTNLTVLAMPAATGLAAAKGTVTTGTGTTLTPTFANGTATIGTSGAGSSQVSAAATSGTAVATGPLAASTTFTLTVTNASGDTSTASSTVSTIPGATANLVASTTSPLFGAINVTVTPTFTNGTAVLGSSQGASDLSASASSGAPLPVQAAGFKVVTTYWLRVTNPAGDFVDASTTITPQAVVVGAITPAAPTLSVASSATFSSTVTGGNPATLTWSSSGGTWAGSTWTAPVAPGTYPLTATSVADPSKSASTTATVVALPTAALSNSGPVAYGATASLTPTFTGGTGSITPTLPGNPAISSGVAIPTAALTTATTYTLTVTNAAGALATASSTVTVTPVALSPIAPATATLTSGTTQAYTVTVSGASNTAIQWSVDGIPGGNAAVGTINATGLYTAGTSVGAHTVGALAAADNLTSRTASVTVVAAPVITSFTASPCSVLVNAPVTITPVFSGGTASIDQGLVGPFTSGTGYASTLTVPGTLTYTLTVTNSLGASVSRTLQVGVQGFLASGSLQVARQRSATAQIPDGRLLVVGGDQGITQAQTELFDPTLGTFANNAVLTNARTMATATTLPDGTVLVSGGMSGAAVFSTDELLDPIAMTTSTPVSTGFPRVGHTATLLATGQVLLVGGWVDYMLSSQSNVELYSPLSLATNPNQVTVTTNLATPRSLHASVLLPSGKVLVLGGISGGSFGGTVLASTELYDPATKTWDATWSTTLTTARKGATATLLTDGIHVLVAGGNDGTTDLNSAEIVDLSAARPTFVTLAAPMLLARSGHQATQLASGQVLLTGGSSATSAAEIYDPTSQAFQPTAPQIESRFNAATALLPDGRALLIGGQSPTVSVPTYSQTSEAFYPGSCTTSVLIQPLAARWWVGSTVPYAATVDTPSADKTVTWTTSAGTAPAGTLTPGTGNGVLWTTPAASGVSNLVATSHGDPSASQSLAITSGPVTVTSTLGGLSFMAPSSTQGYRSATVAGALDPSVTWTTEENGPTSSHFIYLSGDSAGYYYQSGTLGGIFRVRALSTAAPTSYSENVVTVLNRPTIQSFTLTEGASPRLDWAFTVDPNGTSYTASLVDISGTTLTNPITQSGSFPLASITDGYTLTVVNQVGQAAKGYATKAAFTFATNLTSATLSVGGTGLALNTVEGGLAAGPYGALWGITEANGGSLSNYSGGTTNYYPPGLAGTYHLVATSLLDPSRSVTVTLTVLPVLKIMNSGQTLTPGARFVFSHVVQGSADASVTWTLASGPGGPLPPASLASLDANGVVTLAASAPVGTYGIKITSNAFPTMTPATGTFTVANNVNTGAPLTYASASSTSALNYASGYGQRTTVLSDGRVLVTGGSTTPGGLPDISFGSIYHPSTNTWAPTASGMLRKRKNHTATLLPSGKVLITGGIEANSYPSIYVEIFDPTTNAFTLPAGIMTYARTGHTATLLPNGRVLIAGGRGGYYNVTLGTSELFDESTGYFTPIAGTSMQDIRERHTMLRLLDGTILAVGGSSDGTDTGLVATVDRFTPSPTDPNAGSWSAVGNLQEPLGDASGSLLPDGSVLFAGGTTLAGTTPAITKDLQIFTPASLNFTLLPSPKLGTARRNPQAVLGADGQVHFLGGFNGSIPTAIHEVYSVLLGTVVPGAATLLAPREGLLNGLSVLLLDGRILTVGYDANIPSEVQNIQ